MFLLSSSSSSSPKRGMTTSQNLLLCLTCYIISAISIVPSSEAFSRTATTISTTSTCPATSSIRGWGYARQHEQQQNRRHSCSAAASSSRRHSIFYDDFEDFDNNNNNNNKEEDVGVGSSSSNSNNNNAFDTSIFASLKARQETLQNEKQQTQLQQTESNEEDRIENERLKYNWNEANCLSTVRLTLDDWIRRIAIDLYPLVVCGTSRGSLYLGDLEDGDEMDCIENVHASGDVAELLSFGKESDNLFDGPVPHGLSNCLQALYDGHDGNGPFAIAVKKDLIVSSGREGGIHACTIVGKETDVPSGSSRGDSTTKQTKLKLQREGKFRGLEELQKEVTSDADSDSDSDSKTTAAVFDTTKGSTTDRSPPPLITSLVFDDRGTLWAGGYDGKLRGYHHEEFDLDDRPLMLRQKNPDYEIDVGSPILDMSIQEETGVIVVTTETQGVFIYSLDVNSPGRDGNNNDVGRVLLHVNPFAGRGSYLTKEGKEGQKQFCRTAMIVQNGNNNNSTTTADSSSITTGNTNTHSLINEITDKEIGKSTQTLIVAGSFGHMYQFTIRLYGDTKSSATSIETPPSVSMVSAESMQKFRPKHMGPIVSLASPSPGLFVTASQDGTMRVWDCSNNNDDKDNDDITSRVEKALEENDDDNEDNEVEKDEEDLKGDFRSRLRAARKRKKKNNPKVLYALSGYKVWLGSIFANGNKLVSDGADNSIIVHSFDEDEEEILRSQQEDDEDGEKGDEDPFSAFN